MKKHVFHFPFEGHLSSYVKLKDFKNYTIIDHFMIKNVSLFIMKCDIQIKAKLKINDGV